MNVFIKTDFDSSVQKLNVKKIELEPSDFNIDFEKHPGFKDAEKYGGILQLFPYPRQISEWLEEIDREEVVNNFVFWGKTEGDKKIFQSVSMPVRIVKMLDVE